MGDIVQIDYLNLDDASTSDYLKRFKDKALQGSKP
jgi:hypothetical protein